ncbi:MAG: biotin/lipoyl-containing protein [Gemmatimonadales bacterium]
MKYFVTVDGREFEVVVDGERVLVDGQEFEAHLGTIPGTPLRHLLLGDHSLTLVIEPAGRGSWHLAFRGERREVEVVDERTRHIRSLIGQGAQARGPAQLRAPMPGLVARVLVEPGQRVEAGAGLVVLEAMKMENELRAAQGGVVRALPVRPGQAVEKGQLLVEFDP